MGSVTDKVAIVGMGCTPTGEHWHWDTQDMLLEACTEALADAGLQSKDIQAAVLANQSGGGGMHSLGTVLKLDYIPVTEVKNYCATGGDAFRIGCALVAAGLYDLVLVAGAEKLKDSGARGIPLGGGGAAIGADTTAEATVTPVHFALYATRYMHQYGLSYEELKRALARIAVKNHHNGMLNPKAALRKEITIEQAMEAPLIAWPLGLYDCCANVDGGAAAIITRPELARNFRDDYVLIKGEALAVGSNQGRLNSRYDFTMFPENVRASQVAYQMAGVRDPLKELSHAELHDAFTVNELVVYEDLGLAPKGKAAEYVASGMFDLEGQLPTNTDGGLKCTGHPIVATGLKAIYECYKQCQERAGARQVKNIKLSLSHSQGGLTGTFATVIHLLGPRD